MQEEKPTKRSPSSINEPPVERSNTHEQFTGVSLRTPPSSINEPPVERSNTHEPFTGVSLRTPPSSINEPPVERSNTHEPVLINDVPEGDFNITFLDYPLLKKYNTPSEYSDPIFDLGIQETLNLYFGVTFEDNLLSIKICHKTPVDDLNFYNNNRDAIDNFIKYQIINNKNMMNKIINVINSISIKIGKDRSSIISRIHKDNSIFTCITYHNSQMPKKKIFGTEIIFTDEIDLLDLIYYDNGKDIVDLKDIHIEYKKAFEPVNEQEPKNAGYRGLYNNNDTLIFNDILCYHSAPENEGSLDKNANTIKINYKNYMQMTEKYTINVCKNRKLYSKKDYENVDICVITFGKPGGCKVLEESVPLQIHIDEISHDTKPFNLNVNTLKKFCGLLREQTFDTCIQLNDMYMHTTGGQTTRKEKHTQRKEKHTQRKEKHTQRKEKHTQRKEKHTQRKKKHTQRKLKINK
jgi:hypothetical protein